MLTRTKRRKRQDQREEDFSGMFRNLLRKIFTRPSIANILMFSFILLSAFGAGMIYIPAGFITAGVCCGLFGYLLGSE